jgi:hypothetical protein
MRLSMRQDGIPMMFKIPIKGSLRGAFHHWNAPKRQGNMHQDRGRFDRHPDAHVDPLKRQDVANDSILTHTCGIKPEIIEKFRLLRSLHSLAMTEGGGRSLRSILTYSLFFFLFFIPALAVAQTDTDQNQGRYNLVYDSTYIWPDGHGGYDYTRKFVSDVTLEEEGRAVLSRPASPVLNKADKISISAYTKLPSGEILNADTSDMVTRTLPGEHRRIFVNFRRAEPGATLHLEWLLNSKEANIAGKRFLGRTVPVEKAIVLLTVPETWHFNFALTGTARQIEIIRPSSDGPLSATYSWTVSDLPGLSKIEYAPPIERMIPCLYFSISHDAGVSGPDSNLVDWRYLAGLYAQQIKSFTKSNSSLNSVADSISDHGSNLREMANMAYIWVGRHFRPIESEIALSGSVNDALQLGRGTQAEAGAILLALFEKLKIPSTPYLVGSRNVGDPLPQLPALFWFDRMLIAAHSGNDTIWIDPYYQLAQMDILPFEDEGARGLDVSVSGGEFVNLPVPDYHDNGKAIHLRLDFDSTGSIHGYATEVYSGALIPEISTFLKDLDEQNRQSTWEKRLAKSFPGAKIESFDLYPPDSSGQAFKIGYTFTTGPIVRPFADRAYIPMDLLGRWADLPDLPSKARQIPIELGRPRFELERISLNISPPFEVETLPPSYSDNNDIGEVYSVARGEKNSVTITRGIGFKRATLPIFDYGALRKFLNRARSEAGQYVVLRRSY